MIIDVKSKINQVIGDILEERFQSEIELNHNLKLVKELGLSSMDIAKLVAVLELELGVDPFSTGVSLNKIITLGELYSVYEKALI